MELWIRSQDKKLLCKCDSLFIEEELYKRKGKYRIMANNGWLGEYDKLERALEVLDEIQNGLLSDFDFNGSYEELDLKIKTKMINGLYGVIYEIPKE